MSRNFGRVVLALTALLAAGRALADVHLEEWGLQDFGHYAGGGYHGSRTEVSAPVGFDGVYRLSARVDMFQVPPEFSGWSREYSAALSRELYHVTVKGRLGTSPPDAGYPALIGRSIVAGQVYPSYHLAGGELHCFFYGLRLGPEHTELSAKVWESSGTAPFPESFDKTWVGHIGMIYTNTDVHIQRPGSELIVVQNAWQFEFRETWHEKSSLAIHIGGNRYNKGLPNAVTTVFFNNLDYPGSPGAIRGWPNNYLAISGFQALGKNIGLELGATRLNLLNNQLLFAYGGSLSWKPNRHWKVTPGFSYSFRRSIGARRGINLNLAYDW